ncbi:hypothetical protein Thiofri_04963 [Thiorhodovibrio frisius]|nr:hypothetical protein Thiofri_04963 [Thiorhodovibrio frisius]
MQGNASSFLDIFLDLLRDILDLLLGITNASLDLAGVFLEPSLEFQIFVACDMTGDFLHFAFGFFVAALDLLFVHLSVLSMN